MNPDDIRALLEKLPEQEQVELLELLEELEKAKHREACHDNFIDFVRHVWPTFIEGEHHKITAEAFTRVANGEIKRLMIFMPPRHTKSEFASYLFPAWYLGKFPDKKIMQTSNKGELAVEFGRKVRNLLRSSRYAEIFPNVALSADSKAAGRWHTNHSGEYFAAGVGGAVTGRGADVLIIDDPHSEQEAAMNSVSIYNTAYEWYTSGPRQRLQPGGAIVMVVTRWSKIDLPGRVLEASAKRGGDNWEVIELPAILDEHTDKERAVWPGFWSLEELKAVRAELPVAKWSAQFQQRPTSEEGALIKREWWKEWPGAKPPHCEFIIQSWDTAFSSRETADYSACTTWGVFYDDDKRANVILLDALQQRLEFPDLKKVAYEKYNEYQPDAFIVEAKAAGAPLIYELRRLGIPVSEYKPNRGNDKVTRVNSVSDIFASGHIWAPKTRWAEEVIECFAEFPFGDHDDLVDAGTIALLRFRQGGFIPIDSDESGWDDYLPRRVAAYY